MTDMRTLRKRPTAKTGPVPRQCAVSWEKLEIDIPRDREASFEPQLVPNHQKDVSGIEDRVLEMYAKSQSQRDITATIQDIYGFNISHETVSKITERIVPLVQEFRNRGLKKFYPFVFVDAMYTSQNRSRMRVESLIQHDRHRCRRLQGYSRFLALRR
jgi:transposase-like protein